MTDMIPEPVPVDDDEMGEMDDVEAAPMPDASLPQDDGEDVAE